MPKRKRGDGSDINELLAQYENELYRALKLSKGFERQRLSKRLRDGKTAPEKRQRLEREVTVLKVGTRHKHLTASPSPSSPPTSPPFSLSLSLIPGSR